MAKVRLGIIGVGNQGGFYTSLLTGAQVNPGGFSLPAAEFDNIEVGAFCDIDEKVREKVKGLLPNIPVYDNYIEMLESGNVDAIVTCVPHYLHPEMGIEAFKRGIHALLEKPAGVYTKQVKEMIEMANSKPELTFGVFFNQRMNPLYRKLKEIIDNGEIGEIRRTNWIITNWYRPTAYYKQSDWRATWGGEGGGVLVNQAPHQIDLLQWLCGMPTKVYAKCLYGSQRPIIVEDDVTAVFEYENGATGTFVTCTTDINGTDRLEISGSKGKIVVENSKTAYVTRMSKSETEINESTTSPMDIFKLMSNQTLDGITKETETIEFPNAWGAQHADVLRNFAANIVDKTPLVAPGADGINGVKIANAIHLSSWLNKEVDLTNFDEDLFLAELNKKVELEKK